MSDTTQLTKIWVVEQGSYSDYSVVGVFTSEKNARLVADAINVGDRYDEATISEWELDPGVEHLRAGRTQHLVHMLADGTVERCEEWEISTYELAGKIDVWERTKALAYQGTGKPDILTAIVWATDKTHAIKIVNEARIQMLADGRFK